MIESSKLPLYLTVKNTHPSSELPLYFDGVDNGGGEPPKRPTLSTFALCHTFNTSTVKAVSTCKDVVNVNAQSIAQCATVKTSDTKALSHCNTATTSAVKQINNCYKSNVSNVVLLSACHQLVTSKLTAINTCKDIAVSKSIGLSICNKSNIQQAIELTHCSKASTQSTSPIIKCTDVNNSKGVSVGMCHKADVQVAVPVPCRYYPIPIPEPPKPDHSACRLRPPSSQLPLNMARRQVKVPSSQLPLNMTCWHDEPPLTIPIKDTYTVFTKITANIADIEIDPLSFNISVDMKSYCWSGGISISHEDYLKVKSKVEVKKGLEPLLNVFVNNHQFSILAETPTKNEKFADITHDIDGRSVTSRIGEDYAIANDRLFNLDNYASQIVNQQIDGTGIEIEDYDIADWHIPANTYSVSDATPIDVIAEIAETVGGYIESHKYLPKFSLKKRWKINAWDVSTATPDATYPSDVFVNISESPVNNSRYNAVLLRSDVVSHTIHRTGEAPDKQASTVVNDLYTDQLATIPSAGAILSDSGKHNNYKLEAPWCDEIPLINIGSIIHVTDPKKGNWSGVVVALAITVDLVDDAPEPWQTATVKRYLDK